MLLAAVTFEWVYYLLGGVGAVGGFLLLLWALLWDRSRGRRRCPRCWYDMGGTAGLKCPECGREARSERRLLRARRRWGWAVVAGVAIVAGLVVGSVPVVRSPEFPKRLPTGALVYGLPWACRLNSNWYAEYKYELSGRPLTPSQYNLLIARLAALLKSTTTDNMSGRSDLWYMFGSHQQMGPDGTVVRGQRRIEMGLASLGPDPYSLLNRDTAIELADAMVGWWMADAPIVRSRIPQELPVLAYENPEVSRWCLDRLFTTQGVWTIYFVDPRSDGGAAMKRLLAEFQGEDSERRSRAAACLACFYFEINAHWHGPDPGPSMVWIQKEYPKYADLEGQIAPAGDRLLVLAKSGSPEESLLAASAICQRGLIFTRQVRELKKMADRLPPDTVSDMNRTLESLDRPVPTNGTKSAAPKPR